MLSGQFGAVFVQLESAKYHDTLFQAKGKQVEMNFFQESPGREGNGTSLLIFMVVIILKSPFLSEFPAVMTD